MIALFFSCSVLVYFCIVFGFAFSKLFKLNVSTVDKFLLGLVAINTLSSFISLLFPVNLTTLIGVFLISIVILFLVRFEVISFFKFLRLKKDILIISVPFMIYAFMICLGEPKHPDTARYHIQSIMWIESFHAVPGLANLHTRFGYNSNIFTLYALTGIRELAGHEIFSINFTLFSILIIYLISRIKTIFITSGINNFFVFNLIIILAITRYSQYISSPAPDYIAVVLVLYIISRLLDYDNDQNIPGAKEFFALLILSVYTVTVKLSLLPLFTVFFVLFIRYRITFKNLALVTFLCLVVVLPWITRYVILTGWLFYPLTSVDLFNFDWKVPFPVAETDRLSIKGWARIPGEQWHAAATSMKMSEWVPLWWSKFSHTYQVKLSAAFLLPLVTLFGIILKKIKLNFVQIAGIAVLYICLLYWFIMAPDVRFGLSFIILGTICPLIFLRFSVKISWTPYYKPEYLFNALVFILLISFIQNSAGERYISKSFHRKKIPQKLEIPEGYVFRTYDINGQEIYTPGDSNDECFDHCIPCAPYYNGNLVLRGKDLRSGFKIINVK